MSKIHLYIIGNGFDIFHSVKSRYSDFEKYVEEKDKNLHSELAKYFNTDDLWSDFENTLVYLDIDSLIDVASTFLESPADDDWRDSFNHDYQYELQDVIDAITKELKKIFIEWILQLDIPINKKLNLPADSNYLTFNYTDTLEKVYKIPPGKIFYIHNKAINLESLLILGHGRQPNKEDSFSKNNDEDTDPRVAEGNYILDKYFEDTYKNMETIIADNDGYFKGLKEIEEVYVLGHSISEIDLKYFETIIKNISDNIKWTVTYHKEEDKEKHLKSLTSLGLKKENIQLLEIEKI